MKSHAETAMYAVEASALTKTYGKTRAVDSIDLTIPGGSVYGFLGPNGAGKTTTVRMLATLLRPDGGSARVFGHDVVREAEAVRGRISLTGQFAALDEAMTGIENLVLVGRLLGYSWAQARTRSDELLAAFDLSEAARRQMRTFSGGMRRRLDIAASLIVTPDLLFLDEPTTGLDPRSRNQVWDVIRTLVREGTTVLLTTQYLDEADQLADRIAVIDHGKIIVEGTSGQLKSSVGAGMVHLRLLDPEERPEAGRVLAQALGVPVHLDSDPVSLSARIAAASGAQQRAETVAHALAELAHAGVAITDFALGQPSLDEVFLALTGHATTDQADDPDMKEKAS